MDSGLIIEPRWEASLRASGITTVAGALERARCVRDLPDRSNHELEVGDARIHLKRQKPRGRRWSRGSSAELDGLRTAASLAIPVPEVVFSGADPREGTVVGTLALDPARPLDVVLVDDLSEPALRRRVLRRLADVVAALHRAGYHHRDLYLNHVYVDPEAPDPVRGIIDWERHATHRAGTSRWVVKDLAALLSSIPAGTVRAAEEQAFLSRYARSVGLDRGDRVRLARRVARKAARIRRHRPRTPVGEAARPRERGGR